MVLVHKNIVDRWPSFRPILSATGTSSYEIAKFLVLRKNSITSNELTAKDTFCIRKEIVEQDSFLVMGTSEVNLLFTSINVDETIDICTNAIYNHQDVKEFRNL